MLNTQEDRNSNLLRADIDFRDNPLPEGCAVIRVPRVVTAEPWGNLSEGREEEVNRPGNDGVVIPRDECCHDANRNTDACRIKEIIIIIVTVIIIK